MLKQLETDIGAEEFNKILPDVSAIMSKFDLDGDFESYYKTLNSFLSNTLSAKNEKLNSNLEKATKNMNDVFDNFINWTFSLTKKVFLSNNIKKPPHLI